MGGTNTVLDYFRQIAQVPRPSGHEEKIRNWLISWADEHDFRHSTDDAGNLVVTVSASKGYEEKPTVILQAHIDMVTVKAPDSSHDFDNDPIDIQVTSGWMHANKTTLGADNGIGVALMLAVTHEEHPPLELLFTVDEERGLTGALGLDTSLISGKYLINLDTEDEGEICISSAGGARLDASASLPTQSAPFPCHELTLDGLQGGHSGVDIHLSRGNAIRWMLDYLNKADQEIHIASITGGMADNAIPATCRAVVSCADPIQLEKQRIAEMKKLQATYAEPDVELSIKQLEERCDVLTETKTLLERLTTLPEGVQSLHPTIDNLVQTSINMGILTLENGELKITHAARSSNQQEMDDLIKTVIDNYQEGGCLASVRNRYPGWSQNPDDKLVQLTKSCYDEAFEGQTEIVAYHAGLECGAIVGKVGSELQAVSIGPTIKHPHSIHERLELASVETIFQTVVKLLATID